MFRVVLIAFTGRARIEGYCFNFGYLWVKLVLLLSALLVWGFIFCSISNRYFSRNINYFKCIVLNVNAKLYVAELALEEFEQTKLISYEFHKFKILI